ncbi:MAG: holin, BlyA family protein [Lachnospiraceae bacterium]|nr:holin, BlyA family protein [Lachnospiraceae bacterium]
MKDILRNNKGVGVVEVILILVVLIALVLIFKEQLGSMVAKAMEALEKSMNEVLS